MFDRRFVLAGLVCCAVACVDGREPAADDGPLQGAAGSSPDVMLGTAEPGEMQDDADTGAASQPAESGAAPEDDTDPALPTDRPAPTGDNGITNAEPPPEPDAPACAVGECICYELRVHEQSLPGDSTPFEVPVGESYSEWVFDAPWPGPSVIVSQEPRIENPEVIHHYWLFDAEPDPARPDGYVDRSVLGTQLGNPSSLIGSWTVGGDALALPDGVTLAVSQDQLVLQFHHYNSTGERVADRSGVEVCVVPRESVDASRIADVTMLGTENFNGIAGMPAGVESRFSGTCQPSRTGVGAGNPITVLAWLPHMHGLGTHMRSWVDRVDGARDEVFSEPFDPMAQVMHLADPPVVLAPGDSLTAECTFFNDTEYSVAFGESAHFEMCYQLAFAYPAGALRNGALSLIGTENTCW